jgi:hypothetical protein
MRVATLGLADWMIAPPQAPDQTLATSLADETAFRIESAILEGIFPSVIKRISVKTARH